MSGRRGLSLTCAAVIGWALGYALPVYGRLPNLFYDPQHRAWFVGARTGPVPMGYYGQLLFALCGAGLGVAVARLFAWRDRPGAGSSAATSGSGDGSGPGVAGLWAAWMLTAVAVVGAFFTWNNWP